MSLRYVRIKHSFYAPSFYISVVQFTANCNGAPSLATSCSIVDLKDDVVYLFTLKIIVNNIHTKTAKL